MYKKKIIIVLASVFILTGCSSFDSTKCYKSVVKKYPMCEVNVIPGKKFSFLVYCKTSTLYVETQDLITPNVTFEYILRRQDACEEKEEKNKN
jgi:PBP1b-binding outer membrane lipoprotein LpoB